MPWSGSGRRWLKWGPKRPKLCRTQAHSTSGLTTETKLDCSKIIKVGHDVLNMECQQSSSVSSRYAGSMIAKKRSYGSIVRSARTLSANWTCSSVVQSMQRPTPKGRAHRIWNSSS
ncbi:hypothetical protein GOBAR_AA14605 [Gossypium barbadense]|uniref:Uncharacterized protein n=1 Tax=Gossypium barbadense TaxID=3634 RepID=A0A2P5XRS5_GOSBA|nr:hypothetical protein GOBAR_AA14605 [Gossypium barbadense]